MTSNPDFKLRFPKGDDDIIKIFRFLVLVAGPTLLGPVSPLKAVTEVGRIVMDPYRQDGPDPDSFAIVAEINGELVGTIGVTKIGFWWGDYECMTNRWCHIFPALANTGIGSALVAEAHAMCEQIGLDLVISGKLVRRNHAAGRGVVFETAPTVMRGGGAKQSIN